MSNAELLRSLLVLGALASLSTACGTPSNPGTGGMGGAGGMPAQVSSSSASSSSSAASSSSSTSASSSSSTTSSSSGGPVQGAAQLGLPCTSDAACGPLTCLETANLGINGAAPQGGLCTKTCSKTADCPTNGVCADLGGKSYCIQTCTEGSSTPAGQKCRGRHDMGCGALSGNGGSACFPACNSDAACGSGLVCNYGTGLCQPLPPAGDPMGKACNPNGTNTCAGFCLCQDAACTKGFCSGFCAIGMNQGCGEKEGTGICLLQFSNDAGDGDLGACVGDCMCSGDCAPGLVCNGFTEAQAVGMNGVCYTDLGAQTFPTCCSCEGKICGNDGCGHACGSCATGESCAAGGTCCTSCTGKDCGPDGCGGTCGTCAANEICNAQNQCQCQPSCAGKTCGSDGCGGTCGTCSAGKVCNAGVCCTPNCTGKNCGSDSCGGTCGTCSGTGTCNNGVCCQQNLPCSNHNDCCGQYCGIITNTCQACLPVNEFCQSHAMCCSGACNSGNCVQCLPKFALCTSSSQCCNGTCDPTNHWCN